MRIDCPFKNETDADPVIVKNDKCELGSNCLSKCKYSFEPCEHNEHDHGICLDCGKDITDNLVGAAEARFEGDR